VRLKILVAALAGVLFAVIGSMPGTIHVAHADEANLCYQPVFDPKAPRFDNGSRPGTGMPTSPITFTLVREDGSSTTEIYFPNPKSWGPSSGTVVYESALAASRAGVSGRVLIFPKVDWNSMFWLVAAPADFQTLTIISGVNTFTLGDNNGFPRSSSPQNNISAESQGAAGIPAAFLTPDPRGGYHGFLTTDALKNLLPHMETVPDTFQFEMQIPSCPADPSPPATNQSIGVPAGFHFSARSNQ
jgi:hypothetical protein